MQNWKKGYVFGHIYKFGKDKMGKLRKMHRFVQPFYRMISTLKYKWTPGVEQDIMADIM